MSPKTVIGILLALVLAFGGLVHALAPHNHSGGAIDLFHTALHVEQKYLADVDAVALAWAAVLALPAIFLSRVLSLVAIRIQGTFSLAVALRRGVLAYRRFG